MKQAIHNYVKAWTLTIEEERLTPSSVLCFGWQNNVAVVLKFPRRGSDEGGQGEILAFYQGRGAVRLLQMSEEAFLLERLLPGYSLEEWSKSHENQQAGLIFCAIADKLHRSCSLGGIKTVVDLAAGFDHYLQSSHKILPLEEVEQAKTLFLHLAFTQAAPVLLHGDLHSQNILYDEKRGWLAIDPKGYWGEPMYEAGAWLRNPITVPQHDWREWIEKESALITKHMQWNQKRVLQWAYAQAVLSVLWFLEDGENPENALKIAYVLRGMV